MSGTKGFWGTLSGYYNDAKSWLTDSYAYKELTGGWKYGDTTYSMSAAGDASFLYTVGDYAEGAYRNAKSAFNTYKEGQAALAELTGDDGKGRQLPQISMVSSKAGSSYNTGSFSAGQTSYSNIGRSDDRIRRMSEIARNSQLPAIRMTMERTPLTLRGGRRTMNIPTSPTVKVRSAVG